MPGLPAEHTCLPGGVEGEFARRPRLAARALAALGRSVHHLAPGRSGVPPWEVVPRAWSLLREGLGPHWPPALLALAAKAACSYGLGEVAAQWERWRVGAAGAPSFRHREPEADPVLRAPLEATPPEGDLLAAARWAYAAYRQGNTPCWKQADRLMDHLRREVLRPFGKRLGPGEAEPRLLETLCWFLLAARWEVYRAFQRRGPMVPPALAADDPRWQLVQQACRRVCHRLGHAAPAVLDVGCGPGRYLNRLRRHFPRAELVGVDPLAREGTSPAGVHFVRGEALRLPFASGQFHLVLCIETLEHALLPDQACRELLRVVRPGGMVLVIDKHARYRAASVCPPWEQWFQPEELLERLCRHGGRGTCGPVPFADPVPRRVYWFWQVELPHRAGTGVRPAPCGLRGWFRTATRTKSQFSKRPTARVSPRRTTASRERQLPEGVEAWGLGGDGEPLANC